METAWLACALILTIVVELGMLLLLGEKRKMVLGGSVLFNVLTNAPLNLYAIHIGGGWATFLVGEFLVMVVEALCYLLLVKNLWQSVVYSVLCNATSCLTGLLIFILWELFLVI